MNDSAASTLRERKKIATKERIYREALALFRRKGFIATTVDEIAGAADVAKGTFFNYFKTKEAVLNYLGERQSLATAGEIGATIQDPRLSLRQKLSHILRKLADNIESERDLMRMAAFEAVKVPDALASDPYRGIFKKAVASLLAEGRARGEVRPDLDTELVGTVIAGMYFQQVFDWCAAPAPYPLGERLEAMIDLLWHGIGPG